MDLELADRVAVVTGGSKGIGLAVVHALREEGARVVVGARDAGPVRDLEGVVALDVDLAAPDGPGRLIDLAVSTHGRVDVLVNNVGAARIRLEGFLALGDEDFASSMNINFYAALRATRAAVADMLERGEPGAVVNVASVNAFFQPDGGVIDYGAAKAALVNFSKALSVELAPQGIRINNVSPGPVETDLWLGEHGVAATVAKATGGSAQDVREGLIAKDIPTGRFTTPREVATLVALLASPRSGNVTGSSFVIDGGLVKTV